MEFNKIFGATTAALLVYLLANYVSSEIYALEEPEQLAYSVEIEEEEPADAEAEPEQSLPVLLANASVDAGASVFRQCSACHNLNEQVNGVGPHLVGVVGRDVGSVEGYDYSGALKEQADVWDFANLDGFLENPQGWAPGTKMGYRGLADAEDRADVIAYLNEEGGSNLPYPEPEEDAAATEGDAAEDSADQAEAETNGEAAETEAAEGAATDGEAQTTEADAAEQEGAGAESGETQTAAMAEPSDQAADGEAPIQREADEAQLPPEDTIETVTGTANQLAENITTGESAAEEVPELTLAQAMEEADVAYGEEVFRACALCHMLAPEAHGIGPSLAGVIGRDIASLPDYPYTEALSGVEGDWTLARLNTYLEDPDGMVPGVRMGFKGLDRLTDRAAVLAFLNSRMETPAPLPTEGETARAEEQTETPEATGTAADEAEARASEAQSAQGEEAAQTDAAEASGTEAAEAPESARDEQAQQTEGEAQQAEAEAEAEAAPADEGSDGSMEVAAAAPAPAADEATSAAAGDGPGAEFISAYEEATAEEGGKVFRRCSACHKLEEGQNMVGPHLWSVVGRDIASVEGYSYSDALAGKEGDWSFSDLSAFLENPREWAPGTKMGFAGLRKLEERAAVIKYLNEEAGSNVPIQ